MVKARLNKAKLNRTTLSNNDYLEELETYDHYIGLDWSQSNMALARMTRSSKEPTVIDVPASLDDLKMYLKNLNGRKIVTIEETSTTQWLYVELTDYAERIDM